MKDTRSYHRRSIGWPLLLMLFLASWLCLPERFRFSPWRSASAATTFTVTSASDNTCPPTQRNCTLRAAIAAANLNPGLDIIRFQINDGSGLVKTINLASALPFITDPVIIDATTQTGYAGTPLIELNGLGAGPGAPGLKITAGGTTVKGLVINSFGGDGIQLSVNGGNTIQGNFIGTDAAGSLDRHNGGDGVLVFSGNNLIGGTAAGDRNVISGHGNGVTLTGSAARNNQLQGNLIGTTSSGNASLGNTTGVFIGPDASDNTVGGESAGAGNIISGNTGDGIRIDGINSARTIVKGNFIGTDASGNIALGNGAAGLRITNAPGALVGGGLTARNIICGNSIGVAIVGADAKNNQIVSNLIGVGANSAALGNHTSGVDIGAIASDNTVRSNTIANNGGDGVRVLSGTGNSITINRTFSNGRLGIDLGTDGVTPNDTGDGDTGANNLQNFPVLTSASVAGGKVTITGQINTTPGATISIQLYSNDECDPSGHGEGQGSYESPIQGVVDSSGLMLFSKESDTPLIGGKFITATATKSTAPGPGGDTSEFSRCLRLAAPGAFQFSASAYNVDEGAGTAAVTIKRVGGSEGASSVFFSTSDGTAVAGQDYTNVTNVISFSDGETSKTVLVPINDDHSPESGETVNLSLAPAIGGGPVVAPFMAVLTINDNDSGSVFHFSNSNYSASEGCVPLTITVQRTGDTSGVSTVNYATADGTATERSDYNAARGTLRFGPGEVEKSFVVLLNGDSLLEPATETASVTLSSPANGVLGSPSTATLSIFDDTSTLGSNPLDNPAKFVCQHYHDFLNRQPDDAGQQFWTNEIESCGTDQQCREVKRINVSASFFLSIEFQQTGYLVYRMYKAAYGNVAGAPVPLALPEFLPDTQTIGQGVRVGIGDWQAQLEANKAAFANEFVARARFAGAFPAGMDAAQFVDTLNANSGGALSPAERNQLVADLSSGTKTRAQVLRAVAENETLARTEFNRAFVLMEYFGYLRRDPNAPPDGDFNGYNFWLTKLDQFNGNFVAAEMVKAFISSIEYRRRFGP